MHPWSSWIWSFLVASGASAPAPPLLTSGWRAPADPPVSPAPAGPAWRWTAPLPAASRRGPPWTARAKHRPPMPAWRRPPARPPSRRPAPRPARASLPAGEAPAPPAPPTPRRRCPRPSGAGARRRAAPRGSAPPPPAGARAARDGVSPAGSSGAAFPLLLVTPGPAVATPAKIGAEESAQGLVRAVRAQLHRAPGGAHDRGHLGDRQPLPFQQSKRRRLSLGQLLQRLLPRPRQLLVGEQLLGGRSAGGGVP